MSARAEPPAQRGSPTRSDQEVFVDEKRKQDEGFDVYGEDDGSADSESLRDITLVSSLMVVCTKSSTARWFGGKLLR